MSSLPNHSASPLSAPGAEQAFARVEKLAKVLDEAFPVPFTRIKVGLDSVIGLIPVVGDFAGLAIGGYLVWQAHQLGAPKHLKLKMARNVLMDAVAGLVPVLGDVVDVAFRSNRRNIGLMREHFKPLEPVAAARDHWLRWAIRLGLATGLVAGVWWWRNPESFLALFSWM